MNKKVIFKIDKDLDFKNHLIGLRVNTERPSKISPETNEYYTKLSEVNLEEKRKIFNERASDFYNDKMTDIRVLLVKQTQEMWDLVQDNYFNRIEIIHKKSFPFDAVYGILSTTPTVYGYNFNGEAPFWFACSADSPIKAIHTAMHEIMHIYFLEYFKDEYKNKFQLNDEQVFILKESLTVILNLEFNDIRIYADKSKIGHEKIRENITENWLKYKDFNKVLEEACLYIKKI